MFQSNKPIQLYDIEEVNDDDEEIEKEEIDGEQ